MLTNNHPVISIIVPARNEEACLGACLESLVAQTGIAFEIIVVDDDSTDRTAEIARSFLNLQRTPDEGVRGYASRGGMDASGSSTHVGADALVRPGPASFPPDEAVCPLTVISAPSLPDNWTGKNNAMSAG